MNRLFHAVGEFFRKADLLLLMLCVTASLFGIVMVASATNYTGSNSYILKQVIALVLGILLYIFFTLIDIDVIAEHRQPLILLCVVFLALLYPFGVDDGTGNKGWLYIRVLHLSIQPAEVCKVIYIILVAKIMSVYQSKLSRPATIARLAGLTLLLTGLIVLLSKDAGSALVYVAIFALMLFAGGVNLLWFIGGIGALAALFPLVWKLMPSYQRNRILAIYDSSIDPTGRGFLYQTNQSIKSLGGGQLLGQGLFHGAQTQSHLLPQQHTDFIFSVVGEELGMLGCLFVLALLFAIIGRCIYVGVKSHNYMNRLICIGIAGMLLFQMLINVGMCLGMLPVIGLTLPFISYGGSSIVTLFAAMGIVSGISMRPAPDANARYIRLSPV